MIIQRDQKGFTLLEMLVATVIITVGLISVATMQVVAMKSNVVANRVSVDSFIAQQIAEEISSRKITDPILTTTTASPLTYPFTDWSTGSQQQVTNLPVIGAGTVSATYNIQANTFNGSFFLGMTEIQVTVNHGGYQTTYTTHKMVL